MGPRNWAIIVVLASVTAACALRPSLGRSRPDIAAILSFDDGPLAFSRAYTSGKVGPFTIGDSRILTRQRLATFPLLEQDNAQFSGKEVSWWVALSARSGGYSIYTLTFEGERLVTVKAFYSLLAGL